jgi:DnaJ-class molecular chaperone
MICGGDGRISNSFGGSTATCPACHGSGRRADDPGFHDVTKTKPEHHNTAKKATATGRPTWPTTAGGSMLATEVKDHPHLSEEHKAKLTRQIIEYEASHGQCTKTFTRIIRKELRAAAPATK